MSSKCGHLLCLTDMPYMAITGTPSFVWGDVEKMGPALALTMQTVLYGYALKLVTIALTEG